MAASFKLPRNTFSLSNSKNGKGPFRGLYRRCNQDGTRSNRELVRRVCARDDNVSGLSLLAEIRLDRTVNLDRERIAVTILCVARGPADPALADAIFLDVGLLDTLEANADVARQNLFIVVWALRIAREPVGQLVGHGFVLLVHSNASISLVRASGLVVGACRATTLPERSTRNLVKFHLIDEPSSPDFSLLRY